MKERLIDLTQAEQHKLKIRLNKIKGQLASIEGTLACPVESVRDATAAGGGQRRAQIDDARDSENQRSQQS